VDRFGPTHSFLLFGGQKQLFFHLFFRKNIKSFSSPEIYIFVQAKVRTEKKHIINYTKLSPWAKTRRTREGYVHRSSRRKQKENLFYRLLHNKRRQRMAARDGGLLADRERMTGGWFAGTIPAPTH
jgi:hypothetical protein